MGQKESFVSRDSISSEPKSDANNTNNISRELYDRRLLRRCEHIDFDVEAWYPILQCQTFYTKFIPKSPSIAQAFVNYYQTRYNSKNLLSLNDLQLIQSIQHQLKQQIFNSKINKVTLILRIRRPCSERTTLCCVFCNTALLSYTVFDPDDSYEPKKLIQL
jgi:hypothetical protein